MMKNRRRQFDRVPVRLEIRICLLLFLKKIFFIRIKI